MLRALHATNAAYLTWAKTVKLKTINGQETLDLGTILTDKMVDREALKMDWSGKGMWFAYNRISQIKFH